MHSLNTPRYNTDHNSGPQSSHQAVRIARGVAVRAEEVLMLGNGEVGAYLECDVGAVWAGERGPVLSRVVVEGLGAGLVGEEAEVGGEKLACRPGSRGQK